MNELELPEKLKGSWHHALILTYGLDIPFFENALWRQFGARCRNKIILADGRRYQDACANYAHGGLVRHLNQSYVAEGVYAPRPAHAKLILLTNPEQGRLLVGSGNLSWQGYASGGELFTQYEYNADEPETLNAFLAVRELTEDLVERRCISAPAERRIRHLLEDTPWLFQPSSQGWRPVRHNLTLSFLDQLQQVVDDRLVEELWVLSPFYDKELVTLDRLMTTLDPRQATLLMQPDYTSVDPTALQRALDRFGDRCRVCSFSKGDESPYVHAKLCLLKLSDRTICLHGSPNLSQVAMLFTVPQGNIEVANLLTGPRHAFDGLLDALDIQLVERIDALSLSYQSTEESVDQPSDGWCLRGGEWYKDRLCLSLQGELPELERASLVIAGQPFPLDVCRQDPRSLELKLPPEALGLLGRPVPIVIRWGEEADASITNPVFVCNRAALDAVLEASDDAKVLEGIGDLDLDDEEFERLLGELEAALLIDRRSVWQVAGRTPPPTVAEDEEALRLEYADVDYEMLRQHPRIQQYIHRGTGGQGYRRSRLQIILNSITDHFRGLLDESVGDQLFEKVVAKMDEVKEVEGKTEEELDEEEAEKQRRRRTYAQRVARLLKNFIRRYLRGIRSRDFLELAGFEVMAQNYVIFAHILWRLFAKDWVEPQFVIESLLQTWSFFWGSKEDTGYYRQLNHEQQAQVRQWVREHHADAQLLAALYYSSHLTRTQCWEDLRFDLRDFWREILRDPLLEITVEILEEVWHFVGNLLPYEPPRLPAIVKEARRLAEFETKHSFLRSLEARLDQPPGSCRFDDKVKVRRPSFTDAVIVDCLVVRAEDALPDQDAAVALLKEWMRFADLDYYRIASPDHRGSRRVFFYEVSDSAGVYWARDRGEDPVDISGPIAPQSADWDAMLAWLEVVAEKVDAKLVLLSRAARGVSLDR
jgi:hypothetical protein